MPQRRVYARRGVPRRATNRRPDAVTSLAGMLALGTLVLVVVGTGAWLFGAFWSGPGASRASAPAVDAPAATPATLEFARPAPTSAAAAEDSATPLLARRWETAPTSGITLDLQLSARLDEALAGVDGHIGVAVKDLGSGRGALLGPDRELAAASLYKLPVLYTVFDMGLPMSEELPITSEALSYDSGTMELGAGETLSVAEALERMVVLSDNTSAIMLATRVGASRINTTIANLDMDTTHYSLERMTTSAADMLHLLELVARGKAISPAASADMLHLMLRQRVNDRLPRFLPDGVVVAHKTGNLPGTVNDVGVIYGPSATVAIAALISDASDEPAAATAIARLGLAAYSYFEGRSSESANRPTIPPAPTRPIPPVWREPRPTPTPAPVPTLVVPAVADAEPTQVEVAPTPTAAAPLMRPTAAPTAPRVAPPAKATAMLAPTVAPTVKPTLPPTATPVPTPKPTPLPPPTATPSTASRPPTPIVPRKR